VNPVRGSFPTRQAEYTVLASGLKFPEGPVALDDGSVLIVEIARGTLSRVWPDGNVDVVAELGGGPNGAAIGPDGYCYVCNNGGFEWFEQDGLMIPGDAPTDYQGGTIQRVNIDTGEVTILYTNCAGQRLNGPNDLVFDASGGFWFTDTGKSYGRTMDRSSVYYAQADGTKIQEILFPFDRTNGVALSPDDETLYFAETFTARIWQYPLAGPGKLRTPPRAFDANDLLYGAPGFAGFDSMAVEAGGNVCQATLMDGGITVISPAGNAVEFVAFSDPFVTNICFGGPELSTAYITLSGSGQLVCMPWPRPGTPLHFLNRQIAD